MYIYILYKYIYIYNTFIYNIYIYICMINNYKHILVAIIHPATMYLLPKALYPFPHARFFHGSVRCSQGVKILVVHGGGWNRGLGAAGARLARAKLPVTRIDPVYHELHKPTWVFPKNGGFSPQIIHLFIGFSNINHPLWGVSLFSETSTCLEVLYGK